MIRTQFHSSSKIEVALDEFDAKLIHAFESDARMVGRDLSVIVGLSEATISRRMGVLEDADALQICAFTNPWHVGCASVAQIRLAISGDPAPTALGIAKRGHCHRLGSIAGKGELLALIATESAGDLLREIDEIIVQHPEAVLVSIDPVLAMHCGNAPGRKQHASEGTIQFRDAPRQRQTDLKLLRVLQRNMRSSYTKIAKELDLSISVAGEHTRRLIATGALRPIAVYNRALLGQALTANVHVAVKRNIGVTAEAIAAKMPTNVVFVTGQSEHIIAEVSVASETELFKWINQARALPEVSSVRWEAIATIFKETYDWAVIDSAEPVAIET